MEDRALTEVLQDFNFFSILQVQSDDNSCSGNSHAIPGTPSQSDSVECSLVHCQSVCTVCVPPQTLLLL